MLSLDQEAKSLGLQVNWMKTNIQTIDSCFPPGFSMPVSGDNVEVVESFTYLGVDVHNTGSTERDIRKHIAVTCNCMAFLDYNIWHSSISFSMKLQLYQVFILLVIFCGAEKWSLARQLSRTIDAFDQQRLRRIIQICWRNHIPHKEVRRHTEYTSHTHRPYHSSQVFWPHCTCRSVHESQSSP